MWLWVSLLVSLLSNIGEVIRKALGVSLKAPIWFGGECRRCEDRRMSLKCVSTLYHSEFHSHRLTDWLPFIIISLIITPLHHHMDVVAIGMFNVSRSFGARRISTSTAGIGYHKAGSWAARGGITVSTSQGGLPRELPELPWWTGFSLVHRENDIPPKMGGIHSHGAPGTGRRTHYGID